MRLLRYLTQYRVRDMVEMVRNGKSEPLPCSQSLSGKTAVITGATSGIGLETARLFAEKGAGDGAAQKSLLEENDEARFYAGKLDSMKFYVTQIL